MLVQIFMEMDPYPSEESFAEQKRDALTTPLPDDGPYACNEEMTLNDVAK